MLPEETRRHDEALWGSWALVHEPDAVRDVHRAYLDVGCDVLSTNTWGLTRRRSTATPRPRSPRRCTGWTSPGAACASPARRSTRPAATGEVALAFSINGDVDGESRRELLELLPRAFEEDPPDLVLLETMTLVRDGLTYAAVEALVGTGIPVWVSFRRCRHGVCGVFGQHWGGPEGDEFGRAARHFEELGVRALLVNCLPPDHVPGMLPVAARLHRPAARRLPQPRHLHRPTAGASTRPSTATSTPTSPQAGARRARRSSAAAAAPAPSTSPPRASACATARGRRNGDAPARRPTAGVDGPRRRCARPARAGAVARRPRPPACSRSTSPRSSATRASSSRPRAASSSGSTSSRTAIGRGPALPGHRLRHRPAVDPARAQRRRARPRDRHRPRARWPTRCPTPSATASPTA